MIKKVLFLLWLSVICIYGNAQEMRLDSIPDNSFSGILTSSNYNSVYFYYISGKENTTVEVRYTDLLFSELKRFKFEVNKTAVIQGSAALDNGFLFAIADGVNKTRTLMHFTSNGNMDKEIKEEGVDAKLLTADNKVIILGVMPNGFVVLQKKTPSAYVIVKYDDEVKEQWKTDIASSSGNIELVDVRIAMDNIYVLTRSVKSGKQNITTSIVRNIGAMDGRVMFEHVIKDNDDHCIATFMNITDMICTVGGNYYKEGKYIQGASGGIMMQQVGPSGDVMQSVKLPAPTLNRFLSDELISKTATNGLLLAVDGFRNEKGSMSLICELVDNTYVASSKQSEVTVSDLMSMTVDGEGNIEKVQSVRNLPQLEITLKGSLSNANTYAIANWLLDNKLLHYRYSVNAPGGMHVGYLSFDNIKPRMIFVPATEVSAGVTKEPLFCRIPGIESKLKLKKIVVDDAMMRSAKIKEWRKVDVVPSMGSAIRIYNFLSPQLVIAQERNL